MSSVPPSPSSRPPPQQSGAAPLSSVTGETATSYRPSPALIAGGQLVVNTALDEAGREAARRVTVESQPHSPSDILVRAGLAIVNSEADDARTAAAKTAPKKEQADPAPGPSRETRRSEILMEAGRRIISAETDTAKYWPRARVAPSAFSQVLYPIGPVYSYEIRKAGTFRVPIARGTPPKSQSSGPTQAATAASPTRGPHERRGGDAGLEHLSDRARLQPLPPGDRE